VTYVANHPMPFMILMSDQSRLFGCRWPDGRATVHFDNDSGRYTGPSSLDYQDAATALLILGDGGSVMEWLCGQPL
jgi:hypothetical protein